jgi:translation initiation factor 4E
MLPILKHPLENKWSLTYWHNNEWEHIQHVMTMETIEDFWGTYNNIAKLSQLGKFNFAFFHEGMRPIWEDEMNRKGGKWIWEYSPDKRKSIDDIWLNLLLFLIGETLVEDNKICPDDEIVGVTIHTRVGGDRMTLWTKSTDVSIQQYLGKALETKLNIKGSLTFKVHEEAIQLNSSFHSSAKIIMQS